MTKAEPRGQRYLCPLVWTFDKFDIYARFFLLAMRHTAKSSH